jgi:hypothetical protein
MHDEYKQQILETFNTVLSMDMNKAPNYLTMIMIRDKLKAKGVPSHFAEQAVCRAHIMVSQEIFEDQQFMQQVTDSFSEVIFRIYSFAVPVFDDDARFLDLIDGMSLTLAPA